MVRIISLALSLALLAPLTAHAAWWKPATWKVFQKPAPAVQTAPLDIAATTTASTTESAPVATPSVDDLYKRIAELENKLEEAQLKLRAAGVKEAETKQAPAKQAVAASNSSSSDKVILSKVKPALVLVETATTTGSGVIIDDAGDIVIPASVVLSRDSSGTVMGAAEKATATLSTGAKKQVALIGLHEDRGVAVVRITDGGSYSHISLGSQASVKQGDRVYVAGMPSTFGGSGGEGFIAGAISRTGSNSVEATVDKKPLDNGGAMFDSSGAFIGIPNKSSCKVVEDMSNCLKYSVTSSSLRGILDKLVAGMRLFKDKESRTATEELVKGQLIGLYKGVHENGAIDYAIEVNTGRNSFDNFNNRLADDEDGRVTKLYLGKLKISAQALNKAMDTLKSEFHSMNVFMIDQEANIATLGDYQRKTLAGLSAESVKKEKEFEAKVALWSRKKNEYDAYLVDPSKATHDYLMEEGASIADEVNYLSKERKRILDEYSGEAVDIF